jgi:hypothetical protein
MLVELNSQVVHIAYGTYLTLKKSAQSSSYASHSASSESNFFSKARVHLIVCACVKLLLPTHSF